MAELTSPNLDSRDEDTVVADVIDDLPAELSDRNASSISVKLIEGIGAFYGLLLNKLNTFSDKLRIEMLRTLGIEAEAATFATVDIEFSRAVTVAEQTIPAGTLVKTGENVNAVVFVTDAEATMGIGVGTLDVAATAQTAGASGNVATATLTILDPPVAGIDAVTNNAEATGGQDEEPVSAAIARAPLAIRSAQRSITGEDFEFNSTEVDGVERALAVSAYNGNVTIYFLASADLNETPSAALQTEVIDTNVALTIPGLEVLAEQPAVDVIHFHDIEVELVDGYTTADVEDEIQAVLTALITAVDVYDSAQELTAEGWEYNRTLYLSDLISAIVCDVTGVRRVGDIQFEVSTDYGTGWSAPSSFVSYTPSDANAGLLHYSEDYAGFTAFSLIEL